MSSAPQKSRRRHLSTLPQTRFSMSHQVGSSLHTIDPLRHFSSSLGLSSAGVAPLPPCSRKLLDETVKTFTVFPSWLYLLDGDDNCMLSVPSGTSDLQSCCWQSGENCQAVSAGTFTLLCYAFWFPLRVAALQCFSVLLSAHALSARCFPSFRPDTASIRFCLLLPPGFLNTREAGICAGSRAWSSFFLLVWFCT